MAVALARATVGRIPPSPKRLTGSLAIEGGIPVRDVRFRPWSLGRRGSLLEWTLAVGPTLRDIFTNGAEGLPQTRAKQFAQAWAAYCGTRYALLLPHGTDALRIGLAAALDHDGLEYGGEVIVPNLTFIASATAAFDRRLGVALVDVEPGSLNVDPERVAEAIVPGRTRAIMGVHLFGQPADMAALREIAERNGLILFEDAAQAHGALHERGAAGSLGDVAAFSFQSSKNLASGEGGALTTNDPAIFERALSLHNAGRSPVDPARWDHESLGWNCRPSEYVAAVLLHRLAGFERDQASRYTRFQELCQHLEDVECVEPLARGTGVVRHGLHMVGLRYRAETCGGLTIADFLKAAQAEGLPVARGYTHTLAQQPALQRLARQHPDYLRVLPTPVADQAVNELLYIPHTALLGSPSDMQEIAAGFRKLQRRFGTTSGGQRRNHAEEAPTPPPATQTSRSRQPVACGVIGFGEMGAHHARAIAQHTHLTLAAIADPRPEARERAARQYGCATFAGFEDLIASGSVEVLVVATPHNDHARVSTAGLRAGLHVICEKPLTGSVAEADQVLEVAANSSGLFSVVHQTRLEPSYREVRNILASGELGQIYHCSIEESAWRPEVYFRTSAWRGTWAGEGGGVLLNQAPHVLDRYAWLFGMPETVTGRCDTNLHDIEVEDTASAILHHANGAHGYIHVNTVAYPPVSRIVVSCDAGVVTVTDGAITLTRLQRAISQETLTNRDPFGEVPTETRVLGGGLVRSFDVLLRAFYDNLVAALDGTGELACPGLEGRNAVELANAIALSSAEQRAIQLPLSRPAYQDWLQSKIRSTEPALAGGR